MIVSLGLDNQLSILYISLRVKKSCIVKDTRFRYNENMTVLENLIEKLRESLKRNEAYTAHIRDPEMLISSLEELRDLIGNNKVKDHVAKQITKLLMDKYRKDLKYSVSSHNVMLNTAFYGDPGVGKTLLAKKLAKIWYSLGFLEGGVQKRKLIKTKEARSLLETLNIESETNNNLVIAIAVLFWVALLFFILYAFLKYNALFWLAVVISIALIGLIIYYIVWNNQQEQNFTSDADEIKGKIDEALDDKRRITEDDLVEEVSRADFVDKYVGWTDKKTIALLQKNLGKVLFVDEAYSLVTGPDDRFGIDAVNAMNLFLSQHPGEIIVVFAGYKDLLEIGVFSVQPGLKRRFMWHFDCQGYTIDECFAIFELQLQKQGWKINKNEREDALKLFRENKDAFPNYGGDTERLIFFAQTEHDDDYVGEGSGSGMEINSLSVAHIRKGIQVLRENNVTQNKTNILADSLRNLGVRF